MHFILSKLLPLFLLPMGLFFLMMAASAFLWRRRRRWAKILASLAIVLLYLCSMPYMSYRIVRAWEGPYRPMPLNDLPTDSVDAVVVLGGMMEFTGSKTRPYQITDATDRILEGVRLVKAGAGRLLIITGGKDPTQKRRPTEASLVNQFVREFALLPDSLILLETKAVNTDQNAQFTKEILLQNNMSTRVLLVTSALHMPRSRMMFEYYGMEVIEAPTDYIQSAANRRLRLFSILPNTYALDKVNRTVREWMGITYYRLKYALK